MALLVLGAVVPGCGGTHRYDGRLAAVDSLMKDNPDSALALVLALDTTDILAEGDRAYRALLLTQARYKSYVTATSDSDINQALAYFRAHPADREKLTRAYIYKGAVMDELGYPDSAMFYYKTAEATADPADYFNLGYCNLRIASLYQNQFSRDSVAINYRKKAIYYFEKSNDTIYLITCYGDLGGQYGIKCPDSAEHYLLRAIELAEVIKSPQRYTYKSTLAGLYFYSYQDYLRSKDLAMDIFYNGKEVCEETQFYYYAIWSYIRLGMLDSAKSVFSVVPVPNNAVDSMNHYQVIAEIADAENDLIAYGVNLTKSKDKQIQIMNKKQDDKLKMAESDYDRIHAQNIEAQTSHNNHRLSIALSLAFLLIFTLLALAFYLRHVSNRNKEERRAVEQALTSTIKNLKEEQQHLLEMQGSISQLVGYRIEALNELFDSIKFKTDTGNHPKKVRSIIPLSSVIMEMNEAYHIMRIDLTDKFWDKMKRSVDGEFKGIATFVENNYPNLTLKEKRLFCLLCANISPQIIKLCMNYTNVKSVTNNRSIIIRKKMGLDMTFEEFIDKYMKNQL